MITGKESNFVYISDLFKKGTLTTFVQLTYWFKKLGIAFDTIPDTMDLWEVDFMPLQVNEKLMVLYKYEPDYLKGNKYQKPKPISSLLVMLLGLLQIRLQ